jgi:hypothetical protein
LRRVKILSIRANGIPGEELCKYEHEEKQKSLKKEGGGRERERYHTQKRKNEGTQ